ncbi:unnamed protein product [Polarella glacialis]|uniref:Uncharacterized protein n=1 Tax=Polarella glacialis TaxID=89957 RepID=A0A813EDD7_POLGL|nr:unnamed protein product [Polarella glacialis]
MWRSTLCPPVWADAACLEAPPERVPEFFEQQILPATLLVALRLYQSVFRFEQDDELGTGAAALLEVSGQLEGMRVLGCFVRYRPCWTRRSKAQEWRRGVTSVCRGILSSGRPKTVARASISRFCSLLATSGCGRGEDCALATASGLSAAVQLLADAALPRGLLTASLEGARKGGLGRQSSGLHDQFHPEQWQRIQQAAQDAWALSGTVAAHAAQASAPSSRLAGRGVGGLPDARAGLDADLVVGTVTSLLERLDQLAHGYPRELSSMRFDLLYPAWLSPAGVCHADGPAASQLLG